MALIIAGLFFVAIVTVIVGGWWVSASGRRVRQRLASSVQAGDATVDILRDVEATLKSRFVGTRILGRLSSLAEQAGTQAGPQLFLTVGAFVIVGGVAGWARTGSALWALPSAVAIGSLPIGYLVYKRTKRLRRFEGQFPDALDMIARSLRAGYALGGAIQLVGDEMPDPSGQEFKRVSEEIRLGLDPGQALNRLQRRVPTGDTNFFCTAIRIQRVSGGNLAEILDRLSEVIRERFKILSQARALSAQHRWSAIIVGLSPVIFAMLFQLMQPGYFDALLKSPIGPMLIAAGLVLEIVGFLMIWRIAKIEV